jgi:hypothetical protein
MADQENQDEPEESELDPEFILSLCWDSGNLSTCHFNLLTLELFVSRNERK